MNKAQHKLVGLTALGGALEFYDFTIYALFAPYLSRHFFANAHPLISLINTFAVFALGYLARPLGGMVFGHFGDKHGRKTAFTGAVLMMATTTLLMGCLPSYAQIGVMAPLLLILLRLIQGFSVGGEIPGAAVFILEHVVEKKAGFAIGLVFAFITLGNTLGAFVGLVLTHFLSQDHMLAWGWRIPFIIGFALGYISYMIRKKAVETPVFIMMREANTLHHRPFLALWSSSNKSLLFIGCMMTAVTSSVISFFLYLPTYLTNMLAFSAQQAYLINLFSFTSFALCTALFGFLSDKVSRKSLFILGVSGLVLVTYPLFYGLPHLGTSFVWVFVTGIAILTGCINGSYVVAIAALFPAHIRYSGVGLSYSFGVALFGGIAPLVFTWLIHRCQCPEAPAFYIMLCALVTGYAVWQYEKWKKEGSKKQAN